MITGPEFLVGFKSLGEKKGKERSLKTVPSCAPLSLLLLGLGGTAGKEPACRCRRHKRRVRSLGQEDPLEKRTATHSSILAWRSPWTEESGGLQSMGS